jgi:hypothetical protein
MQNSECRIQTPQTRTLTALRIHNYRRQDSDNLIRLALQLLELGHGSKFERRPDAEPIETLARLSQCDLQVSKELSSRRACLCLLEIGANRSACPEQLIDKTSDSWSWYRCKSQPGYTATKQEGSLSNVAR